MNSYSLQFFIFIEVFVDKLAMLQKCSTQFYQTKTGLKYFIERSYRFVKLIYTTIYNMMYKLEPKARKDEKIKIKVYANQGKSVSNMQTPPGFFYVFLMNYS